MFKKIIAAILFVSYSQFAISVMCVKSTKEFEINNIYAWYRQISPNCEYQRLWKLNDNKVIMATNNSNFLLIWNSNNKNEKFRIYQVDKKTHSNPVYIVDVRTNEKNGVFVSKFENNTLTHAICISENNKKELSVTSGVCADTFKQAGISILEKEFKKAIKIPPGDYGSFKFVVEDSTLKH